MVVSEISSKEMFIEILEKNDYVFVDFYAPWCGPCKRIAPWLDELSESEQYNSIIFVKINIDELKELAFKYNVRSIPTFMLFEHNEQNDGTKHEAIVGASTSKINELLDRVGQ